VKRLLSSLRGYWRYLQRSDVKAASKDIQPFAALELPKRNGKDKRRPFTSADLRLLLVSTGKDVPLRQLIQVGMFTGARIEEICSLKLSAVHTKAAVPHLDITDAKTEAGIRQVPIHQSLLPTIDELIKSSTDDYLFPGLGANQWGDRSNTLGRRFGRLKQKLKFDDRYVFHSIRKTVATKLEEAGIPENISARILGHEFRTMSYGLYSGGVSLKVKAEALEKITY